MLSRRELLWGGVAALSGVLVERPAGACTVRALSLGELVYESSHAFVGTPLDTTSIWETVGKRRRVVTYTQVRAEYSFDGRPPDTSELLVRTLGGMVGAIGQVVPGEVVLRRGATAALFVRSLEPALYCVTAMAQGHYPLKLDAFGARRLSATAAALESAGDGSAVHALDRRTLSEAEGLVLRELSRGSR